MIEELYSPASRRCMQFDEKHGGEPVSIAIGWWNFPDGAMREDNPLGALIDPPADPFQRAKLIEAYHKKRLDIAIAAFDERKAQLLTEGYAGGDEEILELVKLQSVVKERQKRWERAVEDRAKADPSRVPDDVTRRREVEDSVRSAYVSRWRKRVEAIEV